MASPTGVGEESSKELVSRRNMQLRVKRPRGAAGGLQGPRDGLYGGRCVRMLTKLHIWMHSEEGATAVEYGIMVALIAAAIVLIVFTLGGQLNEAFTYVSDQLTGVGGGTPAP